MKIKPEDFKDLFQIYTLLCCFMVCMFLTWTMYHDPDTVVSASHEYNGVVACTSNSMGLVVNCGDQLYGSLVGHNDTLQRGGVYVFEANATHRTVHRLAECVTVDAGQVVRDDTCGDVLVFRGDNNDRGELVNRSNLIARVEMVKYS